MTELKASKHIVYKKGYKYQTEEDAVFFTGLQTDEQIEHDYISLSTSGVLLIKEGYAWDGPSGPTLDTKNSMRGSLAHDALSQLMRQGLLDTRLRKDIDEYFHKCLIQDKMTPERASVWYWMLRLFGSESVKPKNARTRIRAPF